jgi:hypothetical protein
MLIEPISLPEVNRLLTGAHYLGRVRNNFDFALATPERDALAVFRAPTAASFTRALQRPLEISRLWAAPGYAGEPIRDRKGFKQSGRSLSEFVATSLRYIRRTAPEVDIVLSYADDTARNSETRRTHYGGIYRASNFQNLGPSQAMPHWIDADGNRISTKMARTRHGTRNMDRIAALEPSWRLVLGKPKLLCCYPMALTVEEALARIVAAANSGRTRYASVKPWPEPWD